MEKQWVFNFFLFSVIVLSLIIGMNFIFDPLQQYRAATLYKPHFTNARYLTPGLAKSYNYDSIIAGSSMTENFVISDATNILGFNKPIKFSESGATAYELNLVLNIALKHKKIKNILYGLDIYAFSGKPDRSLMGDNSLPMYLYDDAYLNDYQYLLNIDTIKQDIKIALLQKLQEKSVELDYNRMFEWQYRYKENDFNETKIFGMWTDPNTRFNEKFKIEDFSFEKLKKSFEHNLLPLIKNNPDVNFYIFYPPYSILAYVDSVENGSFENIFKFKEYIFRVSSQYPNVKLYDFQVAKEVTFNLNNYRDFTHYHQKINHWMLEQIKNENYLVTKKNVVDLNRKLDQQVKSYMMVNKKLLQHENSEVE